MHADPSTVENSAQGLSCQLKYVHGLSVTLYQAGKHCPAYWTHLQVTSDAIIAPDKLECYITQGLGQVLVYSS
jgi:hypothetical protein